MSSASSWLDWSPDDTRLPTAASATATTALRSTSDTREPGRARTDAVSEADSGSRMTPSAATVEATSAPATTASRLAAAGPSSPTGMPG